MDEDERTMTALQLIECLLQVPLDTSVRVGHWGEDPDSVCGIELLDGVAALRPYMRGLVPAAWAEDKACEEAERARLAAERAEREAIEWEKKREEWRDSGFPYPEKPVPRD